MQIVHQTIFMRLNNIYIKRRKTIFICIRQKYSKIHKRFLKFLILYLILKERSVNSVHIHVDHEHREEQIFGIVVV